MSKQMFIDPYHLDPVKPIVVSDKSSFYARSVMVKPELYEAVMKLVADYNKAAITLEHIYNVAGTANEALLSELLKALEEQVCGAKPAETHKKRDSEALSSSGSRKQQRKRESK